MQYVWGTTYSRGTGYGALHGPSETIYMYSATYGPGGPYVVAIHGLKGLSLGGTIHRMTEPHKSPEATSGSWWTTPSDQSTCKSSVLCTD